MRAARDNGLHSVWVSQHYLATPFQMLQQLPVLARIAAEAGSMHLGTNIFLLPIHNPVYVAEQVATLDVICGGRFIFGCGLGYRPEEFAAFDVEMKVRVSRFLEVLAGRPAAVERGGGDSRGPPLPAASRGADAQAGAAAASAGVDRGER